MPSGDPMTVTVDVAPINDSAPHREDDECWCRPNKYVTDSGGKIRAHHSADGREFAEVVRPGQWTNVGAPRGGEV